MKPLPGDGSEVPCGSLYFLTLSEGKILPGDLTLAPLPTGNSMQFALPHTALTSCRRLWVEIIRVAAFLMGGARFPLHFRRVSWHIYWKVGSARRALSGFIEIDETNPCDYCLTYYHRRTVVWLHNVPRQPAAFRASHRRRWQDTGSIVRRLQLFDRIKGPLSWRSLTGRGRLATGNRLALAGNY